MSVDAMIRQQEHPDASRWFCELIIGFISFDKYPKRTVHERAPTASLGPLRPAKTCGSGADFCVARGAERIPNRVGQRVALSIAKITAQKKNGPDTEARFL
jgi:hypothetical protein